MTQIRIDKQNDIKPSILKEGEIVFLRKKGSLFISVDGNIEEIGNSSPVSETDPVFAAWLAVPPNISIFTNDAGYLTGITSLDITGALGYTPVPETRNITINGSTQDLSTSRTWTIFVPTKTSDLTNDSGFITLSALSGYELLSNKSISTSLGSSDTLYPTQNAVKTYVDTGLGTKQNALTTGTSSQYIRGDLTLATFPTNVSTFTNDAGYITSAALSGYVPTTRTLTINGTALDLSADRSWTIPTYSLPALTSGSILFSNGSDIAQNNANLFWNNTTKRLGIGTNNPSFSGWDTKLHIKGSGSGLSNRTNVTIENTAGDGYASLALLNQNGLSLFLSMGGAYAPFMPNTATIATSIANINIMADGASGGGGTSKILFTTGGFGNNPTMTITGGNPGNVGMGGVSNPTARLHLSAGKATAGTAPLKLTAGTNLTTPENGAFEFDGTNLYFTVGGVRKTVTLV